MSTGNETSESARTFSVGSMRSGPAACAGAVDGDFGLAGAAGVVAAPGLVVGAAGADAPAGAAGGAGCAAGMTAAAPKDKSIAAQWKNLFMAHSA
jgi:hypothetical protein